jgi:CheY-like chemotaxis protein
MNRPKTVKTGGRDEPIEDPLILKDCLRLLFETEAEFSSKVEGTSTLPYASRIQKIEPATGEIILKLVRPLPHELMSGAVFRIVFAVDDQRYEALITYGQREAYLQYRFSQPKRLFYADRRRSKRYPFRPRESAYVIASDGGVPGLGVAGPLVNIGLGGLCLRVDRALKLDDGLRIPPNTALFDRGTSFPRVRIQDLPKLPLLEVSGWITHTVERGTEVLLGFDFGELAEDRARALGDCFTLREKMFQARSGAVAAAAGTGSRKGSAGKAGEGTTESQGETVHPGLSLAPLRLLHRKAARLMLVGADDALLSRFQQGLWRCGYHRLELARTWEEALARWEDSTLLKPRLVLLDLAMAQAGDQEPLAAVRQLEKEMAAMPDLPMAILCEDIDPTMFLGHTSETRFLACGQDDDQWVPALDTLLGIGDD